MSIQRFREFVAIKKNDPMDINVLVNNTKEDKKVLWGGVEQVIKAGEEKPLNNWKIAHFLKHTLGLSIKVLNENDRRYDKFKEPELVDPKLPVTKNELSQGTIVDKKIALMETKMEQQNALILQNEIS